ncbi:transketolase C-terminal domain-containing protein [Streptomyces sp. NPDC008001]|uniref:transketolase C-terminal domain-containing protein n=1 Tax=Streptomyces sp. NPDC008001 TaxID=3364804 RepID=UPI0036E089F2
MADTVSPALVRLAARHRLAVTVEDNTRTGGLGSLPAQVMADAAVTTPVVGLGLPHAFLPHGPRHRLLTEAGLTPDAITRTVLRARDGMPPRDEPASAGSPAVPGRAR